jgi:hypothetical protein
MVFRVYHPLSPTLKNVPQSPRGLCPMVKEQYMKIHVKENATALGFKENELHKESDTASRGNRKSTHPLHRI